MRIIDEGPIFWETLETYKGGTPVRFRHAFHQKFEPDDIFVVNGVASCYRPEGRRYDSKICVTHLLTGELSYLNKMKECRIVKCHAVVERDLS